MRARLLLLGLSSCVLTACGTSPADDDSPRSTGSAEQTEDRTCLLPVDMPVTRRSPLWMIDAGTIERVDVFWWHGVPQPSDSDPTTWFTIDRRDEDAAGSHYQGHEYGHAPGNRSVDIEIPSQPASSTAPFGVVTVSTPGQPDQRFALRSSRPCADL